MSQINNLTLDPAQGGTSTCNTQTAINNALFSSNAGNTAPTGPVAGTTWYDSVNNVFNFNNGSTWNTVALASSLQNLQSQTVTLSGKANFAASTGGTTAGDVWNDSVQKTMAFYPNGLKQLATTQIFTQVTSSTINTITTASIINTSNAIGTNVLPANFLTVGKAIRVKVCGTFVSAATVGTMNLQYFLGATGATASSNIAPAAVSTTYWFELEALFTVRTTNSYSVSGICRFHHSTTGALAFSVPVCQPANTLNLTVPNTVDIKYTQTQAGAFTPVNIMMEVIA